MSEVIHGHFTIDRARAREKLSRYQLANPYAYVLELVQSAVLRGAPEIHFKFDSDDMLMSFEAEPYGEGDLGHLEMAVLERADSPIARSRRQLAAGLLAAKALRPKFMSVDSQGSSRLEMREGKPEKLGSSAKRTPGTQIQLRERWHPKLLLNFWRNLRGKGREQILLKLHCACSQIPITINGKLVSGKAHGSSEGARFGECSIGEQGFFGWAGFIVGEPSELEIYCDGVKIETIKLELGALPFRAVIYGESLEKDLSGSAIQRNQAFENMMLLIRQTRERAVEKFCEEESFRFITEARTELLAQENLSSFQDLKTYPGCLAKLKIWKLANDELASFADLRQCKETHGFLPYSTEYQGGLKIAGFPVIWLLDKEARPRLEKLLLLRNVSRRLRSLRNAQNNREKWLSTPRAAKLDGKGYLAICEIDSDGVKGQVGLRKSDTPASLKLIKDACLLSDTIPPGWPKGVEMVLQAEFEPNLNFDGAKPDQTLEKALRCGLEVLPNLYEKIARPGFFHWPKTQSTLNILADYLRIMSLPHPLNFLLRACRVTPQELETSLSWDALKGEENSAQKNLERLLGETLLKQMSLSELAKDEQEQKVPEFEADESWLEEEFFLAALRAELTSLNTDDSDILVCDIRSSRLVLAEQQGDQAVTLDSSGLVILSRQHPLVLEAIEHYRTEPSILIILASVLLSALNRQTAKVSDADEARLQAALLEHALCRNTSQKFELSAQSGEPDGYLEPFCDSGYGTGWANDPSGLGLRFFLEEPNLSSEPLLIIKLDAPRTGGGHDFLFELPRELLDGRALTIWACLVDAQSGNLRSLAGSPRSFAPVLQEPASPIGWLEEVTEQGLATGWCLDPNNPGARLWVGFYLDGHHVDGEYIGGCHAQVPRPEVLELTGYSGDHGFAFQVPEQHNDGAPHKLWVYTYDAEEVSANPLLKGAPLEYGKRSAAPRVSAEQMMRAQRVLEETKQAGLEVIQCAGLSSSGERCKGRPKMGTRFCQQHSDEGSSSPQD